MKEYINYVKKLRAAHTAYLENPDNDNFYALLEVDKIVHFLSNVMLERLADAKASLLSEINLN